MKRLCQWLLWRGGAAPRPITGSNDLHPFSAEWDAFISDAIDRGDVVLDDGFHANVGGIAVWIQNYPYAFGRPAGRAGVEVLPSLETRERLHRACVAAMIAAGSKGGAA